MKNLYADYIIRCKKNLQNTSRHTWEVKTRVYTHVWLCVCVGRYILVLEARGQCITSLLCRYCPPYFLDWSLPIRLCCLMSKPQEPSCCWDSSVHTLIPDIFMWVLKLRYSHLWSKHFTDSAIFLAPKPFFKNTIIFEDKKRCYLSLTFYKPYMEQ